jgi:hypothetical protein
LLRQALRVCSRPAERMPLQSLVRSGVAGARVELLPTDRQPCTCDQLKERSYARRCRSRVVTRGCDCCVGCWRARSTFSSTRCAPSRVAWARAPTLRGRRRRGGTLSRGLRLLPPLVVPRPGQRCARLRHIGRSIQGSDDSRAIVIALAVSDDEGIASAPRVPSLRGERRPQGPWACPPRACSVEDVRATPRQLGPRSFRSRT